MVENYSSSTSHANSICPNTGDASMTSSSVIPTIGRRVDFETMIPYPELYVSQPDVLPPIIRKALTRVLQHNKKGFELLAR